jgi:hypothetical protein
MRIHYTPQWIPASFEPKKKAANPRKRFHTEEAATTVADVGSPRPSDIHDEDPEGQHTDILA